MPLSVSVSLGRTGLVSCHGRRKPSLDRSIDLVVPTRGRWGRGGERSARRLRSLVNCKYLLEWLGVWARGGRDIRSGVSLLLVVGYPMRFAACAWDPMRFWRVGPTLLKIQKLGLTPTAYLYHVSACLRFSVFVEMMVCSFTSRVRSEAAIYYPVGWCWVFLGL